ncbi:hypothetical protein Cgig2_000898 [Carnegiea gigantea]|uniref:Uncharacterized protein n=1 Tax=Carnegiea gigantea TaxID=171969 RepID=A0A9Q1GLB6_9CARY|nr:hypothetical protein Cgig2_000898 [Carnegiea gigantea]
MINPTVNGYDKLPIGVCELSTKKVINLFPEDAQNIIDIFHDEPNPAECIGESGNVNFKKELVHIPLPPGSYGLSLDGLKGGCFSNDNDYPPKHPLRAPQGGISIFSADAIIKEVFDKAILDKVSRIPFNGLSSLKGDFDSLYATILQRGVDVTLLESKVEGLIKQACDFKDMQYSYSSRTSAEEQDSHCMEASHQLNTEGAHYEVKATKLKQVESTREELLKELQLLEDQKGDLSSQVAASEHLLSEIEQEIIDLQGQINKINATKMMDATTKASLEKIKAFIKESFQDFKNLQYNQ